MRNKEVVRLFDLYANDVYRFALSYLGSRQDAEDVVQDVYLKLLSKTLFLTRDREKAYLMKMTSNRCKDLLSSPARKACIDLDEIPEEPAVSCNFNEDDKAIYDTLMRMEDKYRVPIYLYYFEDYSYKEIAKITALSESAVAMRIKRGKEQLRERMGDQYE